MSKKQIDPAGTEQEMRIIFEGDTFIAQAKFEERALLKEAGFDWRADLKLWSTRNPQVASRLRVHADFDAKNKIDRSLISITPWVGGIQWPAGLLPKDFQLHAARWALSRNHSYLALDPGLGKTIVEALIINALKDRPVVIINQPGLCMNTESELTKWCTATPDPDFNPVGRCSRHINIYSPKYGTYAEEKIHNTVLIIPDSMIDNSIGERHHLYKLLDKMTATGDAVLFVDEAQRFNNLHSKRTKAMIALAEHFEKVIFMSGTPLRNDRLMELYPILSNFAGETIDFMSEGNYGSNYCEAYFDRFGHYHADGAENEEQLFSRIKQKFMLRITKAEALPQLPQKTEEIVFLGENTPKKITAFEVKHLETYSATDFMRPRITKSPHLATYRRLLGRYKFPLAAAFIREVLESGSEHLLIFAEHIEVVESLKRALEKYNPLVINGKTSKKDRHQIVKSFQAGKSRVFIGNIQACGIGLTLTKATRVIHVEPTWVPSDASQASDRAHRIGQTQNVLIQYLCFRDSLDRVVLERSIEKREIIKQL